MTENISINNMTKEELVEKINELNGKIKLQEDFLLNISHDLRSPINVILSILQCFKYTKSEDKKEEYNEIIKRNSLKIIKLIDNLIDTTKLENQYYELNKKNVDIVCVVENIVDSIEKYSQCKNIQMVFDTNVEECIVAVDPNAIDRIVMNLLSNAIKFAPSDSDILVNIIKSNNTVNISVEDHGPGIPKVEQEFIFNRFKQSTLNKENEYKGSGIGLDLVHYLTNLHNGDIKLESIEGKGSKFTVSLPITLVDGKKTYNDLFKRDKVEMLEVEFSDIYL